MSLVLFTLSFLGPLSHFLTKDLQLKKQKSYNMINYLKYAKVPPNSSNGDFIKNFINTNLQQAYWGANERIF